MKKVLSLMLIASIVFGFSSCTKEVPNGDGQNPFYVPGGGGTTEPEPTPGLPVGEVPGAFTKKAVLEEFTGEWCGYCPDGAAIMETIITSNPGKVLGIAVHDGDPMEVPAFNSWIKSLVGVSGYPNGSVNRKDATGRSAWTGEVATVLAETAELGIAMVTTNNGGLLDIDVYVGYNAPVTGDNYLTVVLTESGIDGSNQGGTSDPNYMHDHVFRGVLTANAGDPIDLSSSDKYTKVEFHGIDLASFNIDDLSKVHVGAFVNVASGSSKPSGRDILNAQEASLDEVKKWD